MTKIPTYKELEDDLQQIMDRIELGEYDTLDEMLKDHDAGTKLIAAMQKQLDSAKNKISTVSK
ncbi:MAG: exodeoxyribonuclease VII small subunit [Candidatus Saccharimonadales bacterium]|jgi:exodeoxyribonuclease VII small subunit